MKKETAQELKSYCHCRRLETWLAIAKLAAITLWQMIVFTWAFYKAFWEYFVVALITGQALGPAEKDRERERILTIPRDAFSKNSPFGKN